MNRQRSGYRHPECHGRSGGADVPAQRLGAAAPTDALLSTDRWTEYRDTQRKEKPQEKRDGHFAEVRKEKQRV